MFVVWELAHPAFHQCSLFSSHGPLDKGVIIENLQTRLKKCKLQRKSLDNRFLKSHLPKKLIDNPEPNNQFFFSNSATCGRCFSGTCDSSIFPMFTWTDRHLKLEGAFLLYKVIGCAGPILRLISQVAKACLSMRTWHAISEVVHDFSSINSANKLMEMVSYPQNLFNPSFLTYLEIFLK